MRNTLVLAAMAAAVLLTACADRKEPAERAVASVENTLAGLKNDAAVHAADELKEVEAAVAKLKAKLGEHDYDGVLQGAPAVSSRVTALKESVARRKADAEELAAAAQQEWTELTASVPQLVDTLQKRLESIERSRRMPEGVDRAGFESAKAEVERIKASWAEASAEYSAGKAAAAVRRARAAKAKGDWLAHKFGA
jgi:hypothetical protein